MFNTNFDDVLDLCLVRLEDGETIESCLIDYPIYADELKGALEIANRFQSLPIEKPSLAADYLFQQQLDQLTPDSIDTQHSVTDFFDRVTSFIKQMQEPILELGLMSLMVAIIALFFVSQTTLSDPEPTSLVIAKETLAYADLGNMAYDAALVGSIKLEDGRHPLISRDKEGMQHFIHLDSRIANGDLDGDGWEDAAAILFWRDETAIPLWSLVAVRNDHGEPKNVASIFLGPSLTVENLEIIDSLIHITVNDVHGTRFTKIYKLDDAHLTLVDESVERKRSIALQDQDKTLNQSALNIEDEIDLMLSSNRLGDLSYPLEGRTVLFKEGIVNGEYFTTRLLDSESREGDLTNDGTDNAFVALLTQSSHSESVYFLSIVTDGDAEAVPITSLPTEDAAATLITATSLGYHMKLGSVELVDGAIIVEIDTQNNSDVNCKAIIETTYKFKMIENELVAVSAN